MNEDFIIPKLRSDINIEFFYDNNIEFALLTDPDGYSAQPLAIPSSFLKILDLIDGTQTFDALLKNIKAHLKVEFEPHLLIEILNEFNERSFLESPNFYFLKYQVDYYKSIPVRPEVCAGLSYPQDVSECELKLEQILSSVQEKEINPNARFMVVPHIDFSIGKISHEAYASAYHSIKNCDADLFVIFGTSHFGNSDIFMLSEKDFKTPLGITRTDKNIINELKETLDDQLTIDELAHRYEHSIELQVVLLQYLFKNREFTILPVLTGSLQGNIISKTQPNKENKFYHFINALKNAIKNQNKKAFFIASADLAHIGRKFQDNFDAEPILPQLKLEDELLIDHLLKCDSEAFFNTIANDNDKRKICGLAPIYTLLESQKTDNGEVPYKGKLLKYHQWNEVETRSAVSFTSIAYY